MVVWVLALAAALMLAGLIVVLTQPSWFSSLRHTVNAPSSTAATTATNAPGGSTAQVGSTTPGGSTSACTTGSGGVTCTVPSNTYTIVFTTTDTVYTTITEQPSGKVLFAQDQSAGAPASVHVTGASSLLAARSGGSAVITSGGKTILNVGPVKYDVTYTLQPSSAG
jgi:hypothetical protein